MAFDVGGIEWMVHVGLVALVRATRLHLGRATTLLQHLYPPKKLVILTESATWIVLASAFMVHIVGSAFLPEFLFRSAYRTPPINSAGFGVKGLMPHSIFINVSGLLGIGSFAPFGITLNLVDMLGFAMFIDSGSYGDTRAGQALQLELG